MEFIYAHHASGLSHYDGADTSVRGRQDGSVMRAGVCSAAQLICVQKSYLKTRVWLRCETLEWSNFAGEDGPL